MTVATNTKVDLDQLRSREAELAEQVEAKRARISEYPEKIAEANRDLVYAGKRPLTQLNSPLQKLRDAEKKDVASLVTLEGELSAVRSVIAVEEARAAEEETAAARAAMQEFHSKEEATWEKAGKAFAELSDVWNQYVELAEEEDRFAAANGIDGADALAVVPAPLSLKSFLLLLYRAATDPEVRLEPYEEQLIDAGTFSTEHGGVVYDVRPAGTRQIEVRKKLDYGDRLIHVLPDLRSVRKLQLGGRVPTIASER
jgi:hypothetical protein